MDENEYKHLKNELEVAGFNANLVKQFSEDYSTEEIIRLTGDSIYAITLVDDAMRNDFDSLPSTHQEAMISLLAEHSDKSRGWWGSFLQ